jgi:bacteriocin-like protein
MKKAKNDSKKKSITLNRLDKKELRNIYGGGRFCWDSKTKTLYYVP